MNSYEAYAARQLVLWKQKILKKPGISQRFAKVWQNKMNQVIPESVHQAITFSIKNMVRAVLAGSGFIGHKYLPPESSLQEREMMVQEKIKKYQKAAAAEGAGTGAGGIFLGLADFPLLLSIKIKFLFDTAGLYGFDTRILSERVYILYIFQLAFSSDKRRQEVFHHMEKWDQMTEMIPMSIESIDWRLFQQEYRDYIDFAKLMQLMPGVGAFFGAYANYQLMNQLGETAMNCYRMRLLSR